MPPSFDQARILFLSPRQPWPADNGSKIRDYYFARALGLNAQLTYLLFCNSSPPNDPDFPRCEQFKCVPRPKTYTAGKILRGIVGRWPLPVLNYTSKEMAAAVTHAVQSSRFDLVHVGGVHMAAYIPHLHSLNPQMPVIYDWHNIESELMQRYAENIRSLPKRIYAGYTATRLARVERWMLTTGFGHIVCSERERSRLLEIEPGARVAVVGNGVDITRFGASQTNIVDEHRRRTIVFVGSMSYHANIEAAVWFARRIWTRLHEQYPELHLKIVGANPAPDVLALSKIHGVEVTGTVPDVRPYYEGALTAIAPIQTGGGTRLKILEAMAAGVPVISTSVGAEGLDVEDGRNILIADTEEAWIGSVTRLLNGSVWSRLVEEGRHLTQVRYDWAALGARLCDIYRGWLNGK